VHICIQELMVTSAGDPAPAHESCIKHPACACCQEDLPNWTGGYRAGSSLAARRDQSGGVPL